MTLHIGKNRQSPYTIEQHQQVLAAAIESCNINPYRLVWHYLHVSVMRHGSISEAAERLGLHRRTVQRILGKREPRNANAS